MRGGDEVHHQFAGKRGVPDDELDALMTAHDACLESGDAEGRHDALTKLRTLLLERTYLLNLLATVRRESSAGEAAAS